jgi:hypothetical protein
VPNLWRQFKDLLPGDPLLIGTVAIRHADGSATVTLLDGGQLHVLGDGAAGSRVFVQGGRVTGEAPDLPSIDIEI